MKRFAIVPLVIAVFALGVVPALAQSTFKVPFKWESGGKKFAAGDYVVTKGGDNQLTFKQVTTEKETLLAFTEKLKPAEGAPAEARLVFDEVGNFEPSYTEYFTVYVLAEVWLGHDGYLVHTTKGAHKTKTIAAIAR